VVFIYVDSQMPDIYLRTVPGFILFHFCPHVVHYGIMETKKPLPEIVSRLAGKEDIQKRLLLSKM